MELKVNPKENLLSKGLGITEERAYQILDISKDWLKDEIKNAKEDLDRLDFLRYCASICENLEEYTLLTIHQDAIIEQARVEAHEETCPRCKARKETRERIERDEDRFGGFSFRPRPSFFPGAREVIPGVYVISL